MIFTAAGLSAQRDCTIISTSFTNLTTDGGVIIDGTQNVTIYCLCMINHIVVSGARWFFPNGTRVRIQSPLRPGSPYFRNIIPTPLIIPSFVHPYDGTYGCGPGSDFSRVSSYGDTITLTLSGMSSNCLLYH